MMTFPEAKKMPPIYLIEGELYVRSPAKEALVSPSSIRGGVEQTDKSVLIKWFERLAGFAAIKANVPADEKADQPQTAAG